jgi:small neutral amino acid transporter SnatA (MarC family)
MRNTLGLAGILGLGLVIAGLFVIALDSLVIAGGLGLVLIGLGLVTYGLISRFMRTMGMGMGRL